MIAGRFVLPGVSGKTYQEAVRRAQLSGRTIGSELDDLAKQPKSQEPAPADAARAWSAAIPTSCTAGHRHASRLEARVCDRLTAWCAAQGYRLFQQVRLPLLASAPAKGGRPLYMTVDFAVYWDDRLMRLVDAKGRVSREWCRGAAALAASCGVSVEEANATTLKDAGWPGQLA